MRVVFLTPAMAPKDTSWTIGTLEDLCVEIVAEILTERNHIRKRYAKLKPNPFQAYPCEIVDKLFNRVVSSSTMYGIQWRPVQYRHVSLLLTSGRLRKFEINESELYVSELVVMLEKLLEHGSNLESFALRKNFYMCSTVSRSLPLDQVARMLSPFIIDLLLRSSLKCVDTDVPFQHMTSCGDVVMPAMETLVVGTEGLQEEEVRKIFSMFESAPNLLHIKGDVAQVFHLLSKKLQGKNTAMPTFRLRIIEFTWGSTWERLLGRHVRNLFKTISETCPFLSELTFSTTYSARGLPPVNCNVLRALLESDFAASLKKLHFGTRGSIKFGYGRRFNSREASLVEQVVRKFGRQLEAFNVLGTVKIDIGLISDTCQNLRELRLRSFEFTWIAENGSALRPLTHLEVLELHFMGLDPEDAELGLPTKGEVVLLFLSKCKNLKHLTIDAIRSVFLDDAFVDKLTEVNEFPFLESLELLGTALLTHTRAVKLKEHCPKLVRAKIISEWYVLLEFDGELFPPLLKIRPRS